MRRGHSRGKVTTSRCVAGLHLLQTSVAPELTLRHEWDDPHGAVATETFHLSGEDEHNVLTVVTHIMFRDKRSVNLRTVYRRLG